MTIDKLTVSEERKAPKGYSKTRLYRIWEGVKYRTNNSKAKSYKHYGGRGIKMCEEWKTSFHNFYYWSIENGYESSLSLDRIEVNGNYKPSNCRWVNSKQQARNKQESFFISYKNNRESVLNISEVIFENKILNGDIDFIRFLLQGFSEIGISLELFFKYLVKGYIFDIIKEIVIYSLFNNNHNEYYYTPMTSDRVVRDIKDVLYIRNNDYPFLANYCARKFSGMCSIYKYNKEIEQLKSYYTNKLKKNFKSKLYDEYIYKLDLHYTEFKKKEKLI